MIEMRLITSRLVLPDESSVLAAPYSTVRPRCSGCDLRVDEAVEVKGGELSDSILLCRACLEKALAVLPGDAARRRVEELEAENARLHAVGLTAAIRGLKVEELEAENARLQRELAEYDDHQY